MLPPHWFERRFDPFPLQLLPNLLTRLRGTPARLEDQLRAHPEARLTRRPGDRWSAQEHLGHLLDLEPLWLARVRDFVYDYEASATQPAGNPAAGGPQADDAQVTPLQLTPADLQNRKTHEAQHNRRVLQELLAGFRAARANLVDHVGGLDPAHFERAIPHPRLRTPMRLADHLYFVAEHDDHHLAHIWHLLHEAP